MNNQEENKPSVPAPVVSGEDWFNEKRDDLIIWNGIENEMYEIDSFKDAQDWAKAELTDSEEGIHPDAESVDIYQKVGGVYLFGNEEKGYKLKVKLSLNYRPITTPPPSVEASDAAKVEGYWKKRCEAAEEVITVFEGSETIIGVHPTYFKEVYDTWQSLRSTAPQTAEAVELLEWLGKEGWEWSYNPRDGHYWYNQDNRPSSATSKEIVELFTQQKQ